MAKNDLNCVESATPGGYSKTVFVSNKRYRRHMGLGGYRDRRTEKQKKRTSKFDSAKWKEGNRGRESPMEKGERLRDKAKKLFDSVFGKKKEE